MGHSARPYPAQSISPGYLQKFRFQFEDIGKSVNHLEGFSNVNNKCNVSVMEISIMLTCTWKQNIYSCCLVTVHVQELPELSILTGEIGPMFERGNIPITFKRVYLNFLCSALN